MPGQTSRPSRQVSQSELADLFPLLTGLSKSMARRKAEVPLAIKNTWHERGLAPRHMQVLVSLGLSGPMSVSELSERLDVGLATTSLLVGELSRAGLIVRREDDTDRRRTIVDLIPSQRQAVSAFVQRRASIVKSAIEGLEPAERAGLIKGLRMIIAALDAEPVEIATSEEPHLAGKRR